MEQVESTYSHLLGTENRGKGLLPLGTIVSVSSENDSTMMIYRQVIRNMRTKEIKDYAVVFWPQGDNPADQRICAINDDDITAVHFRGYENALSQELAEHLEKKRRGSLFSRIIGKGRAW